MHIAIAFALIRLGKISGKRRPGTGPAPRANVKTNLHKELEIRHYIPASSFETQVCKILHHHPAFHMMNWIKFWKNVQLWTTWLVCQTSSLFPTTLELYLINLNLFPSPLPTLFIFFSFIGKDNSYILPTLFILLVGFRRKII